MRIRILTIYQDSKKKEKKLNILSFSTDYYAFFYNDHKNVQVGLGSEFFVINWSPGSGSGIRKSGLHNTLYYIAIYVHLHKGENESLREDGKV
jgi:hypothetical protein